MLNNRTSPAGLAGGINFKSGDISGTAAKTADDRASQGMEYFRQDEAQQVEKAPFVDRSAALRASLASLALINASCIIRNQNRKSIISDDEDVTNRIKPAENSGEKEENKKNGKNNDEEKNKHNNG